jgi:hypothetical protein
VHNLSTSFVLGYHGCDRTTAELLLRNEPFLPSSNDYDWLGTGIYFWQSSPDRALDWARERSGHTKPIKDHPLDPYVVGAVVDPGFCLDLISAEGIVALEEAYSIFKSVHSASGIPMPRNVGGDDLLARNLDCAVINHLHDSRSRAGQQPFDTVRGVFMEGQHLYENSGFRRKTHIQICVRNPDAIKGVFRVPDDHFTNL